jgi:Terminase small subunit
MSVLDNPKQEAFCQAYSRLRNGTKAAIEAGYSASGKRSNTAAVRASTLLKDPKIKARIAELDHELTKVATRSTGLDRAWVLDRLKQNADQALEERDRGAANRALELLGREVGLFTERKQILVGPLEQLDAPRLQRLLALAEAAEQGRLVLPGGHPPILGGSTAPIDIAGEIIEGEVLEAAIVPEPGPEEGDEEDFDVLG